MFYALVGAGVGALVVLGAGSYGSAVSGRQGNFGTIALVVAVVGALLGYAVGSERAFALRLMAQTALCQLQIERNTRLVISAPVVRALPPGSATAIPRDDWRAA